MKPLFRIPRACWVSNQRHLQNISQLHDFVESVAVARVDDDYMKRWAEAWGEASPLAGLGLYALTQLYVPQ